MSTSHKQIVQSILDMLNQRNLDWIDMYLSDDFVYIYETFYFVGFWPKYEDGKAIIDGIFEDGPCTGKLQPGDEILSLREAGCTFDTMEDIRDCAWGMNPGEKVQIRVQRNAEQLEFEITPSMEKGRRVPQTKEQMKEDIRGFYENNPEFHITADYMVAEGDLVAVIASTTGVNKKFKNRPYAFSQAFLFEFVDDKITAEFEVHNTVAERRSQGYRISPPED